MWWSAGTDLEEGIVRSESTRDGRSRSDIRLGPNNKFGSEEKRAVLRLIEHATIKLVVPKSMLERKQ